MTVKLVGSDTIGTTNVNAETLHVFKFTATATGKVSEIYLYAKTSGSVKVAIYEDNAGEPTGARVTYNDSGQAVTLNQWNTLTVPEGAITEGSVYWICAVANGIGTISRNANVGVRKLQAQTYSTWTWPANLSGTWTPYTTEGAIAGWGLLLQTVSPSGIEQIVDYGTPQLNFTISPSGIEQLVDYGTPQILPGAVIISPSGIAQLIVLGTPAVQPGAVIIAPSGIAQLVALGTPTVTLMLQVLSPTGINQVTALGTPKLDFILYPSGISQAIALGTPALITRQFIYPSGITQAIVFGTPSLAMYGRICPVGIAQVIAYGTPSMLKYVWHIILDGQYITESPDINRAYIIGRDIYGNPVYGTAVDSTELGLVGERLDFQQELSIPSTLHASNVASAVLAKMRLTTKRGVILIPPNCGQELWDVVQISDSLGNQTAVKFRVVGLRFEYHPREARYQHKLILGAP